MGKETDLVCSKLVPYKMDFVKFRKCDPKHSIHQTRVRIRLETFVNEHNHFEDLIKNSSFDVDVHRRREIKK